MASMKEPKKGKIGARTKVWDPSGLWGDFSIGDDCTIGRFVEIGDGVRIGDRCKVEAFAFIPPGVVIEDEVFVGPHACFTNDRMPRAVGEWKRLTTPVKRRASIGANATILPGPHHAPTLGKMSQGWKAG
jgi:acetyltransferase-like isoleucine patch superfamily enzyme